MANFDLGSGPVLGSGAVSGGVSAGPSVSGLVGGIGDGINNVRGRVVAGVFSVGLVGGAGSVSGGVNASIVQTVTGSGVVAGAVRGTADLAGAVLGAGVVSGAFTVGAAVSGLVGGVGAVTGSVFRSFRAEVDAAAVVTGAFDLAVKVAGAVLGSGDVSGSVRGQRTVTGLVSGVGSVTGGLRAGPRVAGTVSGTQALGGTLRLGALVTAKVVLGVAEVTGSLVRERSATASAEGDYEASGVRRALPILVYVMGALRPADADAVPDGGSFLVGTSYTGSPGDPFYEAGAAPNAVGTKVKPPSKAAYLTFRQPLQDEVVWFVPGEATYRFRSDRDTGAEVWQRYRTMPERAGQGMRIFDLFDPDGIYPYFLKALGAIQAQMSYDNRVLLQQGDPDLVSQFYLPELAANYGLALNFDDTLPVRRAKTKNAVAVAKTKGMAEGVRLRLRSLGYTGHAAEIWVAPDNGGNFQSAATNANATPTSGPTGAGTATREYPHGYRADDPSDGYFLSSRVAIHVNDGSGNPIALTQDEKSRIARELGVDVLPAHVDIRWFATDVPAAVDGITVSDTLVAHGV